MLRTSNPVLSDRVFTGERSQINSVGVMTLDGTVNKTLISILVTTIFGYWAWADSTIAAMGFVGAIAGLILALVISFKHTMAPTLTPVYAAAEGIFLGGISRMADTAYPGVVFSAVSLTFGTLFCLLFAYKSGYIKATENFKLGVVAATSAIALVYLITMIVSLFGVAVPFIHSSGPLSIGISVFVVIVAAANLVMDFDFIENAAKSGSAPKYMEWYGAFGLLVTLVWLYLEILRLLLKLNQRR